MPAAVGARSAAPRVLSERLATTAGAGYAVQLEGLAGRAYTFRIGAPSAEIARRLTANVSAGATATLDLRQANGTSRLVTIIFPVAGANADGYSSATATFSSGVP